MAASASTRRSPGSGRRAGGSPPSRPPRGPSAPTRSSWRPDPQTDRLAAMLGVRVPLAPSRVEMICTEPLPLMKVGGVDGNGLYGRQTRRGNLVYGGGPHEWLDQASLAAAPGARPTTPLLRSLGRRLAELFRGAAHMRVIRSWAGIVENTPDGLPIIDRLTQPANVVLATMSSVGFGLSPASGHAISELVLHGECRFANLTALRLSRFADTPPDWRAPPRLAPRGQSQGHFDFQTMSRRQPRRDRSHVPAEISKSKSDPMKADGLLGGREAARRRGPRPRRAEDGRGPRPDRRRRHLPQRRPSGARRLDRLDQHAAARRGGPRGGGNRQRRRARGHARPAGRPRGRVAPSHLRRLQSPASPAPRISARASSP